MRACELLAHDDHARLPVAVARPGRLRHELARLDPEVPVGDVRTMGTQFADTTWRPRTIMQVLTGFGVLARLLAGLGSTA